MTTDHRTSSYHSTIPNTPEGEQEYRDLLAHTKRVNKERRHFARLDENPHQRVKVIKFVRRFRLGKNNPAYELYKNQLHPCFNYRYTNKVIKKEHGVRFDVYRYEEYVNL